MRSIRRAIRALVVLAGMMLLATACGSDNNPNAPPLPPPVSPTVTITSSGVSPKNLVVSPGTQVTFLNSDSRDHEINSNPHPDHSDCPAINSVGHIVPGQSKQTGNLVEIRACGYHDHIQFLNTSLQGTITVQ